MTRIISDTARRQVFQYQADAVLSQANPVSGTKYTVLNTTVNVRVISASANVTWTVQPTPLEIHATVDSNALTFNRDNPVTVTPYVAFLDANAAVTAQGMGTLNQFSPYQAFLFEGRSVKIEAEITGGTVQNLGCRVKYSKI